MEHTPPAVRHLPPHKRREGFSLLITITLLAFLVLLLVSLAALTRVETQVAGNSRQLAQARSNALAGLQVALGQLQKHAGPDQRVTARAEWGAAAVRQPGLTGVWDASAATLDPAQPAVWLVSGNEGDDPRAETPDSLDPLVAASDEEVFLVGDGTVDTPSARIKARKQAIAAEQLPGVSGSQNIGAFAYWIGDEGVKASVSLVDPHPAAERRHSFLAAQRLGIERVARADGSALGLAWPAESSALARVFSLEQLPLAEPASETALREVARHRFHDLTGLSHSVLADVARGGLKKDLTAWLATTGALPSGAPADSDPLITTTEGADPFMPRWGLLRSWNELRSDGTAQSPRPQTESSQGLHPVMTYFRMGIAVSDSGVGQPLKVHLFPVVVLWNPHNIPIAASDYELCYSPRQAAGITFGVKDTTSANRRARFHLRSAAMTSPDTADPNNVPWYRFPLSSPVIGPGESFVFTLADPDPADADAPYSPGTNLLINALNTANSVVISGGDALSADDFPAEEDDEPLRIYWSTTSGGGDGDIVLRARPPEGHDALPANPDDYYRLLEGAYHTVQRAGYGSLNIPASSTDALSPKMQFTMQVRVASSTAGSRWIAQNNLRAPIAARPGFDGGSSSLYLGGTSTTPNLPAFSGARASMGNSLAGSKTFVLAEFLPEALPLFSLAQLRHVNLSPLAIYPSYVVGNSLADFRIPRDATSTPVGPNTTPSGDQDAPLADSILNAHDISWLVNRDLWDRYFFSTAPATLSSADLASASYRLPNPRHRLRADVTDPGQVGGRSAFDTAAAHLLVAGGFNVNSTSEQAWRALLSGLNGLRYDPANDVESGPLEYPFSRYIVPSSDVNADWSGYRSLTAAQIDRLAWNIAREVRARGPFRSLADFVNRRVGQTADLFPDSDGGPDFKGALQAAIDRTDYESSRGDGPALAPINTHNLFKTGYVTSAVPSQGDLDSMRGGRQGGLPQASKYAFAPGYLSQADLLSPLGPALTARSDTFLVRVYGESLNPVTGAQEGRAWCEVIVQRTPDYVDASLDAWETPAPGSVNHDFGRRFQVVSFRWLSPQDI